MYSVFLLTCGLIFTMARNYNNTGQPYYDTIDPKKYCQKSYACGKIKHTVCEFGCRPNNTCKNKFYSAPNNSSEKQAFLDIHNYLRNYLANGTENRNKFQTASNMHALNWNDDIAYIAYCTTLLCVHKHDKCRNPKPGQPGGQNIWELKKSQSIEPHNVAYIRAAVMSWYSEIIDVKDGLKTINSFTQKQLKRDIGHFTQVVWALTREVGCSRLVIRGSQATSRLLIYCNYWPAGNYEGDPTYLIGTPQSQCPKDSPPNKEYNGLCGEIKMLSGTRLRVAPPTGSAIQSTKQNVFVILLFIVVLSIMH